MRSRNMKMSKTSNSKNITTTEEDEIAKVIGNVIQNEFKTAFQVNNSKMLAVLNAGRTNEFITFFCVLPGKECRRLSMTRGGIYTTDTITTDGQLKIGGLMDPRQGIYLQYSTKCQTCNGNIVDCPGHYGHIKLAKPVYHMGFLTAVKEVLRSICFFCFELLISPSHFIIREILGKPKEQRLALVYNICKHITVCKRVCRRAKDRSGTNDSDTNHGGCGRSQPNILLANNEIIAEWKNPDGSLKKIIVTAERARDIIKRIMDVDLVIMGMDPKTESPQWMILTHLPIPPLNAHCSSTLPELINNRDYFISIYSSIIKCNNELIQNKLSNADPRVIAQNVNTLQFHVASIMYHLKFPHPSLPHGVPPKVGKGPQDEDYARMMQKVAEHFWDTKCNV